MTTARRWRSGPVLLVLLAAVACQARPSAGVRASGPPATVPADSLVLPTPPPSPPPVMVRGGGRELTLTPWSFCWSGDQRGVCADGRPPESPPDIGHPAEVEVEFTVPGFHFVATAVRFGERCGRAQSATLEATGPTTHRLRPMGVAGDYVVTMFGSGGGRGQGGDLSVSFRWHTPTAGPNEGPSATASIVTGKPAEPLIDGFEISVQDLRRSPASGQASARMVVTSADGKSVTLQPERRILECAPEGSLLFQSRQQVTGFGAAPFRYEVRLVIDGETYVGTATWPDDMKSECSPCTPLRFSPPLPGI
jgi:hypothetical protein